MVRGFKGTLTFAAGASGGLALAVVGALPRNWRRAAVFMALFLHAAVIVLTAIAVFRAKG